MKILFAGNKERGKVCLETLLKNNHDIVGVVLHDTVRQNKNDILLEYANKKNIEILFPEDVNELKFLDYLKKSSPDLSVLAGYGKIVKKEFINVSKLGCINLHAGKLPEYRGSSPLNWALINGEKAFTLSIVQVDEGIDTGDILNERTFPIAINDSIKDLHHIANKEFPEMLVETLEEIKNNNLKPIKQNDSKSSYYPLRFPEDGLILWDMYTSEEVHNRIRALTTPYPGAFTYFENKKVKLIKSEQYNNVRNKNYFGESGRIYKKNKKGILVCAKDKCLWITEAKLEDEEGSVFNQVQRYDKFATIKDAAMQFYEGKNIKNDKNNALI